MAYNMLVQRSDINDQEPMSEAMRFIDWKLLGDAENTEEAFLPGVWPLVSSHL